MSKPVDFIGQRFGRLIVVSEAEPKFYFSKGTRNKHRFLNCKCDCGNLTVVSLGLLRAGKCYSCGCLRKDVLRKLYSQDLTGKKFGRLLVVSRGLCGRKIHTQYRVKCDCGKMKDVLGIDLVSKKTLSCGCLNRENSKKRSGKNSANWQGGITPEVRKIRCSIEYGLWRSAVFARDGWMCQTCGQRCGKLNAHHIKSFSKFPELRFAIDNGITFCGPCHKQVHAIKRISA